MLETILKSMKSVVRAPSTEKQTSPPAESRRFTMAQGLERLARRGVQVETVIDVGASDGHWAEMSEKCFPRAHHFLIEAQMPHEAALKNFVAARKASSYIIAAAGARSGEVFFDNTALYGGLASDRPFESNCIRVPVIRIDDEVSMRSLKGPYLVKLDTHGYEHQILDGCEKIIDQVNAFVIEAYNFQIAEGSLLFFELCQRLKEKGFLPVDIVDLMSRPNDECLWQMDIFFMRSDNAFFKKKTYQ